MDKRYNYLVEKCQHLLDDDYLAELGLKGWELCTFTSIPTTYKSADCNYNWIYYFKKEY